MPLIIKIIILAIVEGISEWLPISSTGHLLVLEKFMNLEKSEEFKELFFVLIQLGAILAIITIFIKRLFFVRINRGIISVNKENVGLWCKIGVALLPGIIIMLLFDDYVEKYLHTSFIIALMLIFYGIIFLVIKERNGSEDISSMGLGKSFKIGLFQCLSIIPGTSRSGATIIGGIFNKLDNESASEFSFLLAIPVMFGISVFKILKVSIKLEANDIVLILVGMVVSFIVSLVVAKKLLKYISKHSFKVFGIYRIFLGIIILFLLKFF